MADMTFRSWMTLLSNIAAECREADRGRNAERLRQLKIDVASYREMIEAWPDLQERLTLREYLLANISLIMERYAPAITLGAHRPRSEEHTSELQSLMRISYAVFCLKKKT